MGYELVDAQASNRGRLLRIFIDKPGGITVQDCAEASRQLTRVFAVEGIDYDRLEVSSPGLDRPLRHAADYRRFAGRLAKIVASDAIDGQKHFVGRLRGVEGDAVVLEGREGRLLRIPLAAIARARLEVEF